MIDHDDVRREARRRANRRYYVRNREAILAHARGYRRENAAVIASRKRASRQARLEEARAEERAYEAAKRAERNAAARARRQRDPTGQREANRRWQVSHPGARRKHDRVNYARRRGLRMRAADVVHLLGDLCAYCSGPADSIDHIDAIAVGGDGSWTNLTAACGRCNSTKVHKPLLLFLATRTHPVEAS